MANDKNTPLVGLKTLQQQQQELKITMDSVVKQLQKLDTKVSASDEKMVSLTKKVNDNEQAINNILNS